MNIVFFVSFSFLLINSNLLSQSQFKWNQKANYSIDSIEIWAIDVLGNTYISKKENIQKFDSNGVLKLFD
jgi:hypothetical protein